MPSACFTGHRKLGGEYYNRSNPSDMWHSLHEFLSKVVWEMMSIHKVNHFISGLAIGVDMLGADLVAHNRAFMDSPVLLTGAMPFPSQPSKWPEMTRQEWHRICGLCNDVVSVSADPYHPSKMQVRNKWMVDRSSYVIAVWNGETSGGTWNCMKYAHDTGKQVLAVVPETDGWTCAWRTPGA